MMFCPKCGSILVPNEPGKKSKLVCSRCGYKSKDKKSLVIKEKVKLDRDEKIEIMDQKVETLSKVTIDCDKCGNKKAYYWMVQTRASDEAETKFYECTKCGHRWREYS